jgi:hypothetical protein
MDGEGEIAWEAVSTDRLATDPRCWALTLAPPGMASPGSGGLCHDRSEKAHLITPGFDKREKRCWPIQEVRAWRQPCPGFENEIQGVYRTAQADGTVRFCCPNK